MDKRQLEWLLKLHRSRITESEYIILLLVLGDVPLGKIAKNQKIPAMKLKVMIDKAISKLI